MRERLLTYGEAADVLRCSVRTRRRQVRAGALPSVGVGGLRRFRHQDLERFVVDDLELASLSGAKRRHRSGVVLAPHQRLWD